MSETDKPRVFRIGDVVCLKSGGPPMTIADVDVDFQIAECRWYWRSTLRSRKFACAELMHVSKEFIRHHAR